MLRGSMQSIRWRCWCRAAHEGPLARGTRCRTRRILSIGERVRSGIFFATMALASAISLLRGFVVAGVLDPAAFGTYVVIVAAGTFGSNLLSFGRVEATWKEFPRLWIAGERQQVRERADAVMRMLAARALYACIAIIVMSRIFDNVDLGMSAVAGVAVALGVACTSVYASVLRASYDLGRLGQAALYRAGLALLLAAIGAGIASSVGALIGEVLAAAAGVVVSRRLLSAAMAHASDAAIENLPRATERDGPAGGRWLAAAFLVGAVPFYLDRLFVASSFSPQEAGTYGFLMLFASGAAAAVGVITQKLGPQLLREERAGATVPAQLRLVLRWAGAFCVACVIGMSLTSWLLLAGPAQILGGRYALSTELIAVISLLCCVQVTVMFDWILISRDREHQVFLVAAVFLAAACSAALATLLLGLELLVFIVLMLGAKVISLAVQLILLASSGGRRVEM